MARFGTRARRNGLWTSGASRLVAAAVSGILIAGIAVVAPAVASSAVAAPIKPVTAVNTVLTQGTCGNIRGRNTWHYGANLECHRMYGGKVVALRTGPTLNLRKYAGTPVQKQMAYAAEYWATKGPSAFKYLPGVNCANFVSQTLLARGWKMNSRWHNYGGWKMSSAWISSTALRNYIRSLGTRTATELNDSQRSRVKVGDVAQFDWDKSGDRDHTAVVSKVVRLANGKVKIYVAEHTDPWFYRDVDDMITRVHPGGRAYYWSLR